ncbi:MinD/ParA family protein [Helicobacter kayseriensis]|uniref:MinD/ParA family protein n=1 Tax=Helicobacter kayseriensis TaxID=2905877 RepID=UPI001E5C6CD4|nr:MinD/ParA family protein [Helicobacter kayseriensis]MCE3048420.1 MinD/ParA family protein [Helicobacter kayseriensis]
MKNQATDLIELVGQQGNKKNTEIIAITSGKGGVGKSSISANLSYTLCKMGYKVAVFDADIGLANLDLIFGVKAHKTILNVLKGECELKDIIIPIENGLYLIPGDSGDEIFNYISEDSVSRLVGEGEILSDLDYLIIDTGAGIGGITQKFLESSDTLIVITMPDPSAITDAYAAIKVNAKTRSQIYMILNMVKTAKEAENVYLKMKQIAYKNIENLSLELLGYVPLSSGVSSATRGRTLFSRVDPGDVASLQLKGIARKILQKREQKVLPSKENGFGSFFQRLLKYL